MKEERIHKTDIISDISKQTRMNRKDVAIVINTFIALIQAYLQQGKVIDIWKLGIFKVSRLQSRKGFNPATMESIQLPARNIVRFTESAHLKECINQKRIGD